MPVGLQHARFPRALDVADLPAHYVPEDVFLRPEGLPGRVGGCHRQDGRQAGRDGHDAPGAGLGPFRPQRDLPTLQVAVLPCQVEQLPPTAPRLQGRDDEPMQMSAACWSNATSSAGSSRRLRWACFSRVMASESAAGLRVR